MARDLPVIIKCVLNLAKKENGDVKLAFKVSVLLLTFLTYMSYNLSRKPITVVKNVFLQCNENSTRCRSWITELEGTEEQEAKTLLGLLDSAFLISYSIAMFFSGYIAERLDLRYFLTAGMLLSGTLTIFLGLAYQFNIHSIWYLIVLQVLLGLAQSTGWPGVVTVMANWFGKGRRGLIMGVWVSHTSFGNIVGSIIAGSFVSYNWGLSFIVPGILVGCMGVLVFLFLVPSPQYLQNNQDNQKKSLAEIGTETEKPMLNLDIQQEKKKEEKAIGFIGALKIPGVVEFSLSFFFAKLVKYTFLYWLPNYIHVQSGLNAENAAFLSTVFDVGCIMGGIVAGLITDATGMSATTCTVMTTLAIPVLFLYQAMVSDICPITQVEGVPIQDSCFFLTNSMLVLAGILVQGPYSLIATAVSADLGQHPSLAGSKKALATVTAIIDGTGSLGTVAVLIAGPLSSNGHWENVIYMLVIADFLAVILIARLVKVEVTRWYSNRKNSSSSL